MAIIDSLLSKIRNTGANRLVLNSDQPIYLYKGDQVAHGRVLLDSELRCMIFEIMPDELRQRINYTRKEQFAYNSQFGQFSVAVLIYSGHLRVAISPKRPFEPASCTLAPLQWELPPIGQTLQVFKGSSSIGLPHLEQNLLIQAHMENWNLMRSAVQKTDTVLNVSAAVAGMALGVDGSNKTSLVSEYEKHYSAEELHKAQTQVLQLVLRVAEMPNLVVDIIKQIVQSELRSEQTTEEAIVIQLIPKITHKHLFSEYVGWNFGVMTIYITEDVECPSWSQVTLRYAQKDIEDQYNVPSYLESQAYKITNAIHEKFAGREP